MEFWIFWGKMTQVLLPSPLRFERRSYYRTEVRIVGFYQDSLSLFIDWLSWIIQESFKQSEWKWSLSRRTVCNKDSMFQSLFLCLFGLMFNISTGLGQCKISLCLEVGSFMRTKPWYFDKWPGTTWCNLSLFLLFHRNVSIIYFLQKIEQ